MIAIIDYGAGNLHSVKNALDFLNAESIVTGDSETILNADKVILPGVGAFGDAMKCLGIFKGKIVKIPEKDGLKIPHMGWNSITVNKNSRILKNIGSEPYVYFVHSYYVNAEDESIISAYTEYGQKLDIAVEKDNVFATQFHPEKSGETGMTILKNFIAL